MLDKQIHAHLDKQDKLEIGIEDDIDALMKIVNIGKLISNPKEVLFAIVKEIGDNINNNYAQDSINNGIEFAKGVIKTKADIKVQKTSNPELNKNGIDSDDKKQD